MAMALTHNEGRTRATAALVIKTVGNVLGGQETLKNLIGQLKEYLWSNLQDFENQDENLKISSVKFALNALVKAVTDGKRDMAEHLVPICYHPGLVQADSQCWIRVCQKLGVDPKELVQARSDQMIKNAIENIDQNQNAIEHLSRINPEALVPKILEQFYEAVKKTDLKVTEIEVEIYKTPEDQVYDRSSIDALDTDNDTKNIKRESKAYSHKDQLEEIALRKELEKKRGKREMTPKQKEAFKAQLEKESVIRSRLTCSRQNLWPILNLLRSSIKGQPKAYASFIGQGKFLSVMFKVLACPLFKDITDEIFLSLRYSVFESEDETLSQTILASTILITRSKVKGQEKLLKVILDLIHKSTCGDPNVSCPFTTPAFHLAFKVLKEAIWALKDDQDCLNKGLLIINEHSGLEGSDLEELTLVDLDELHPKYLPRKEMLTLLVDLLAFNGLQTAVSALIAVCACSSGKPGLATITDDELSILFNALKHESQVVRDAALRGLDGLDMALDESNQLLVHRLFVAKYDPNPENQVLADNLWDKLGLEPVFGLYEDIIQDVVYPVSSALR